MSGFRINNKGVTIIELLVVMVLVTIVAGYTIPQFQKSALRQEFVTEIDSVMDEFRIAQNWARNSILEQQPSKSVIAYQIVKEDFGFTKRQRFGDGTNTNLVPVDLAAKNIEISSWPSQTPNGF